MAQNDKQDGTAAQDGSQGQNNDDFGAIIVEANREGNYIVRGGDIKEMIEAFNKWRPEYAPDAQLFLRFRPKGDQLIDDVQGQLRRDDAVIDLNFDDDGLAPVPVEELGDGKWELSFNKVKGSIRIFPTVYSPGTGETVRRIGDLRLECRVFWGFYNNRVNLIFRGLFDLFGGCNTKSAEIYYPTFRTIKRAMIDGQAEPQPLKRENKSYLAPLSDKNIASDTILRIDFAPEVDEELGGDATQNADANTDTQSQPPTK
jgi:hypothetical protein